MPRCVVVSIRSPHRSKGRLAALAVARSKGRLGQVSIRSPHRSKGRQLGVCRALLPIGVSIRSPHRSKGRLIAMVVTLSMELGFNPLPSPKQGETRQPAPIANRGILVSIRSPHRSKGRPCSACRRPSLAVFQSAPLTEARGDRRYRWAWPVASCFNPLPSPKQGETPCRRTAPAPHPEFQSAPLTEARGDVREALDSKWSEEFQSAPLTEARGDATTARMRSALCRFQSAPLTEARGDSMIGFAAVGK